jgi:low molecular weight protein-tyrosine phosphatase
VALEAPLRSPCDVTAQDLTAAALIVAVKEREHRPMLAERFPDFTDTERVRYWDVDDVPDVPAPAALARLETLVRALVLELSVVARRE